MDTMSVFCFHALGHSLQRIAMLCSGPQSQLFTHLLCSELKYFALKPERKTVIFFYLAAVGKSHKITVSFNQPICLSMQGGKLAFFSPYALKPHPSIG